MALIVQWLSQAWKLQYFLQFSTRVHTEVWMIFFLLVKALEPFETNFFLNAYLSIGIFFSFVWIGMFQSAKIWFRLFVCDRTYKCLNVYQWINNYSINEFGAKSSNALTSRRKFICSQREILRAKINHETHLKPINTSIFDISEARWKRLHSTHTKCSMYSTIFSPFLCPVGSMSPY